MDASKPDISDSSDGNGYDDLYASDGREVTVVVVPGAAVVSRISATV
ncbi:hypothetical protein [Bradyrhizobium sp. CB3481]|nr:hypothetical protein [Bradyrhizobium sp. CB3481]WFU19441.1 hypothetical protein QA643_14475 [Bradyrhizobium sp. CB3481]